MRTSLVLSLSLLLVLGVASSASAATVGIAGGTLLYAADPGEANELFMSEQQGRIVVQDGTVGNRDTVFVRALPPCVRDATPQPDPSMIDATCPPERVRRMAIALGDGDDGLSLSGFLPLSYPARIAAGPGNDRVLATTLGDRVFGGRGNDTLNGAQGEDLLNGGRGDDVIISSDGFADRVVCGPGNDRVHPDGMDIIDPSCETISFAPPIFGPPT
jgi:hypothetical protein